MQHDLATLLRRLHDRETGLQRRHAPAAVVPERLAAHDRVVELLELGAALAETHGPARGDLHVALAVVVVNVDAVLRLPQVGAVEAGDREPHVLRRPSGGFAAVEIFALARSADADRLLVGALVAGTRTQRLADRDTLLGAVDRLVLAPGHQLSADEVAVAVVDDGRGYAVL